MSVVGFECDACGEMLSPRDLSDDHPSCTLSGYNRQLPGSIINKHLCVACFVFLVVQLEKLGAARRELPPNVLSKLGR